MSGRVEYIYVYNATYFDPNDLRCIIVAENGMQQNAKTNKAHDPRSTNKNKDDTHTLICSISSEVRTRMQSDWSRKRNCFVKQVVLFCLLD